MQIEYIYILSFSSYCFQSCLSVHGGSLCDNFHDKLDLTIQKPSTTWTRVLIVQGFPQPLFPSPQDMRSHCTGTPLNPSYPAHGTSLYRDFTSPTPEHRTSGGKTANLFKPDRLRTTLVVKSDGKDWRPFQTHSLQDPFPNTGADIWRPLKNVHMVGRWSVRILLECFLVTDCMHEDLRYGKHVRSEQIKPGFIIKRI